MNLYRHVENNFYDVQIKEEQLQESRVQRRIWLLVAWHPAYRRQDPYPGAIKEKENQVVGGVDEVKTAKAIYGKPESNDTAILGRMKL